MCHSVEHLLVTSWYQTHGTEDLQSCSLGLGILRGKTLRDCVDGCLVSQHMGSTRLGNSHNELLLNLLKQYEENKFYMKKLILISKVCNLQTYNKLQFDHRYKKCNVMEQLEVLQII